METIDLKNSELIALNYNEMLCINGGNAEADQAAYEAGQAVGDFVQTVVAGVALLVFIFL